MIKINTKYKTIYLHNIVKITKFKDAYIIQARKQASNKLIAITRAESLADARKQAIKFIYIY